MQALQNNDTLINVVDAVVAGTEMFSGVKMAKMHCWPGLRWGAYSAPTSLTEGTGGGKGRGGEEEMEMG